MNSTNSKEWHLSQINEQNTTSPVPQSSQIQHYSSSMDYPQPYQGSMHPPALSSPNNFGKSESDPRLPGMMGLSQPGTPRPGVITSPKKGEFTSSFQSATPYGHAALNRKRGRNDLFSTELGPFFSSTKPVDNVYGLDRSTLLTVRIQAKMDRGFFLADNDWTCYRRNYFQVSGAFSIHGINHYYSEHEAQCLVQDNGVFYPVYGFSMNISARVSSGDKAIDLVQHTPKRDKGPQTTPSPKPIIPGGNLSMSSVGGNQSIVTFERIQFKTATANNGKRRAAQQYYVCLVDLYAEIEGGNRRIKIASCQSAPLVVRGRSPGHYSDNHDRYDPSISHLSSPPQQQQQQSPTDNRYTAPFPRPPMTPPAVMGGEYGSAYPYPPYPAATNYPQFSPMPGHMQSGMMPPTPTGGALPPLPSNQNGPNQQQQQPYMIPGMSSEPSSSETSSPDLYQQGQPDDKMNHPHPGNYMPHDWNRPRDTFSNNSSYFSQSNYQTNNSNPSTPYGPPRKYSSIPQQTS